MLILLAEGRLTEEVWACPEPDDPVPATGPVMLPPPRFQQQRQLQAEGDRLGLLLPPDADLEALCADVAAAAAAGVFFPAFTDGRGFSLAQMLRRKPYSYAGRLIALGRFLPDQVSFMRRCGFDAAQFDDVRRAETALQLLQPFSETYQQKFGSD